MDKNLRIDFKEFVGVVVATAFAVALLVLVMIPLGFCRNPGEVRMPSIAQALPVVSSDRRRQRRDGGDRQAARVLSNHLLNPGARARAMPSR